GGVFGTVDVSADGGADHELIVGGELADAQREAVVETLFEPGSEQPRRREPVDIARVGDAADIVGDVMAAVVELKDAEMCTGAGPAGQFFQVGVDREFETAFVAGAPIDAAGQHGEGLADIGEGKLDALVLSVVRAPPQSPVKVSCSQIEAGGLAFSAACAVVAPTAATARASMLSQARGILLCVMRRIIPLVE